MVKEELRYVQTFISDWLSAPVPTPEIRSIEYYRGPEGGIRFFADFRHDGKKIAVRNEVTDPYNLSYFDNDTEVIDVEISIHWEEEPTPDYTDDQRKLYFFETGLDEDLKDYILLPANPEEYVFADNIEGVIFDNTKSSILVGVTDLDDLRGFKLTLIAYKIPSEEEVNDND